MRSITVYFEDEEFKRLQKAKGPNNWRKFILTLDKEKKPESDKKCETVENVGKKAESFSSSSSEADNFVKGVIAK